MSIAMRVKHLLERHGHSLRQAGERTGVSYETIRRITKGYEGPTVIHYVCLIAKGYGINEKALLEGMDPKGDFEWTIHQAPPVQRLDFLMVSRQERVRLTLDFLDAKYPTACACDILAAASGLSSALFDEILSRWESRQPDLVTATAIAQGIHRLTGISMSWFIRGWIEQEGAQKAFIDRGCAVISRTRSRRHSAQKTPQILKLISELVG